MKQTIAVIFGGQSSEHEVSCMSVVNVASQIDREKYDVLFIGITEEGHWVKVDSIESIQDGSWKESQVSAVVSPDATEKCVILWEDGCARKCRVDAAFPVLHGLYGEDGTIQGLFELAQIPYVGCGVLASAVSMDKLSTKIVVDRLGIRQAQYVPVYREELEDMAGAVARVEAELPYPVFVKPSNAGSSRGVSKAEDREGLEKALREAARHDRKILVEETIVGHEVECAVFGGGKTPVQASGVGEILAAAEFYDFEAKYYNPESRTVVNPPLPGNAAEEIRRAAVEIFRAVDGYGLSRVDFFVKEDGEVVFNEINTMPGFTAISMYPTLWEAAGMDKKTLVQALIDHAFARYDRG
ncbi:MAG TPA: D-alanine--D-alanine ligase [Candidatus Lachnoclostridium stercorigallinarum]|uniref:D-alanine--D-alanine ligase n=1 Tax=Candidatus Lachnoclostridium stercorigallinarum TaxID=2838634 RepID=A0A9D2GIR5_9FIRM|nr:D-alanine--D-alanine ligase [Candidatus Lachnoclostridium stercorigallinarum]